MNKSKRISTKLNAERLDRHRKEMRESACQARKKRERAIAKSLAAKHDPLAGANAFMRAVGEKAPKLLNNELSYVAVDQMRKVSNLRCVEDWQPTGKGYQALLVSLAKHLFAAYPMPAFIWSVFWDEPNMSLAKLVAKIANGESLNVLTSKQLLPVPLTKKQCHLLMSMPAKYSFMDALRYVQVMSAGGNQAIFEQWRCSRHIRRMQSMEMEYFWFQVLHWVCKQGTLQPKTLVPLLEYIAFLKGNDTHFNMKGRALPNMLKAMYQWQQLERMRKLALGLNLPESGLLNGCWAHSWTQKRTRQEVKEHWSVTEILSDTRLLQEGRMLNHCVYSYRSAIRKGRCSIWSVVCDKQMKLTIEVDNRQKHIVQVKGKSNREPSQTEWQLVRRWASLNGLRCQ